MSRKSFRIALTLMAVVIAALVWLNVNVQRGPEWEASYQTANSRIEWTGAGYSGIYARSGR